MRRSRYLAASLPVMLGLRVAAVSTIATATEHPPPHGPSGIPAAQAAVDRVGTGSAASSATVTLVTGDMVRLSTARTYAATKAGTTPLRRVGPCRKGA
jgi:hypothetical protein